jgi:hypothetical protein
MNVAGKSLQDIYDAGSKRLEELDKGQKAQLNDITCAHLEERQGAEPASLKELESHCGELEGEIRAYLMNGIERVEKVVVAESEHTTTYIQRLVDGLALLAKKFNESISQLRETAENQLNDLSRDNEQLFKSTAEAARSQINHEGVVAIDNCHGKGMEAHQGLSKRIEESCNILLEKEDEAVAEVLTTYDTNADQLQSRFVECRKQIEEQLTDSLSKLELRSMQATEGVKSAVDQVVETADRFVFDSDVKLKERFSALLYEMSTCFDEAASCAQTDILSLHESSMADLTMKSQQLSREMDGQADGVADTCRKQSSQLQDKGNSLLTSYTNELDKRLELSKVFQQDLEKERASMVAEIWKELSEVQTRFQERLTGLSTSTLEKMRSICDESEKAIITSQHTCIADSKTHAGDKLTTIEEGSSKFIVRIRDTRDRSLDAIAKAAGASSDDTEENAAFGDGAADEAASREADSAPSDEAACCEADSAPSDEAPVLSTSGSEKRRRRTGKSSDKRGEGKK